jgi:hypothetical protein
MGMLLPFPHSWPVRCAKCGNTGTVTAATGDLAAKPLTGYKIAWVGHYFGWHPGQAPPLCCALGSSAMLNGLRVKLDRYEAKAAHCQRAAQEATDEHGRAFYEELADYYGNLARDFRQVIANREAEEREQRQLS